MFHHLAVRLFDVAPSADLNYLPSKANRLGSGFGSFTGSLSRVLIAPIIPTP